MSETQKQKRLWDNYKVIGEVKKSDKIKIVVGAGIRDGVKYLNVREFYFTKKDSTWKPGRDGITIPLSVPIENGTTVITPYTGLIDLFIKAAESLETMELYDENNAVYAPVKERK